MRNTRRRRRTTKTTTFIAIQWINQSIGIWGPLPGPNSKTRRLWLFICAQLKTARGLCYGYPSQLVIPAPYRHIGYVIGLTVHARNYCTNSTELQSRCRNLSCNVRRPSSCCFPVDMMSIMITWGLLITFAHRHTDKVTCWVIIDLNRYQQIIPSDYHSSSELHSLLSTSWTNKRYTCIQYVGWSIKSSIHGHTQQ